MIGFLDLRHILMGKNTRKGMKTIKAVLTKHYGIVDWLQDVPTADNLTL
jgi:hypothetical protein